MIPDPARFAKEWEAGWNSHDLDRIMAHYSEDITFRSRKAADLTGAGTIFGKTALRAYWAKALARQRNLHFTVERVFSGHEVIVITYRNQLGILAAETLRFAPDGMVIEASASHDASPQVAGPSPSP